MLTGVDERADEGYELTRLASADNFRDVAGPGYLTADGVRLRRGVLFRSNELQLSDVDAGALRDLGIRDVLDLRDHPEVEAHPDAEVPGAAWTHVRVPGIPMDDVATLTSRAEGLATMKRVYRVFVEDDGARAAFGELLTVLADAEHPQLFHCTAGKDRTGVVVALLLSVAGVDDETIVNDYALTGANLTEEWMEARRADASRYGLTWEALRPALETPPGAMRATLAHLREQYGDASGYLVSIGVAPESVSRIRVNLTEMPPS